MSAESRLTVADACKVDSALDSLPSSQGLLHTRNYALYDSIKETSSSRYVLLILDGHETGMRYKHTQEQIMRQIMPTTSRMTYQQHRSRDTCSQMGRWNP
jgi:hypothetical protein